MLFLRCFLIFLLFLGAMANPALAQEDQPTTPTTKVIVEVKAVGGLQMDVWLDGERLGLTPLQAVLEPGDYLLTGAADAIVPVIQGLKVVPQDEMGVVLPVQPMNTEQFPKVAQWVMGQIQRHRNNDHLLLIALLNTFDAEEARRLLAMAQDRIDRNDPFLLTLRAITEAREGNVDEALSTVERAIIMEPRLAYAWRVKAELQTAKLDLVSARESANEAVLLEPGNWRNLRIRSQLLETLGEVRAAEIDRERAREIYETLRSVNERLKQDRARQLQQNGEPAP